MGKGEGDEGVYVVVEELGCGCGHELDWGFGRTQRDKGRGLRFVG